MSRKNAREGLMKFLYQIECIPAEDGDMEIFLDNFVSDDLEKEFIVKSYNSIVNNFTLINSTIEKSLVGWSLGRLNKIDISILRIATNEILFFDDIPTNVSINEAVENAKLYSTEDSSSFINGVLANLIKNI